MKFWSVFSISILAMLFPVSGSIQAQDVIWTDVTTGLLGDPGDAESAGWGDYDNDGDLDLYITTWTYNKLMRNDGPEGFTYVSAGPLNEAGYAKTVNWIDFNNDGWLDLLLVNYLDGSRLFRNQGGGSGFVDATPGLFADPANAAGASWGDYDGDGWLDLYITSFVNSGAPQPCRLYRNENGTAFADVTTPVLTGNNWAQGADWVDWDNDGDLDLFVARAWAANYLYRNDDGVFTDVAAPYIDAPEDASLDGAWADYDNDGDLDLYLVNWGANRLYRNEGGGVFLDVTAAPLDAPGDNTAAVWCDYDLDGDLDLYLAAIGANQLLRNDGGEVFTDVTAAPLDSPGVTWGATMADYDLDGDLDLYLVNGLSGVRGGLPTLERSPAGRDGTENALYRNDCANGNHWLQLVLTGEVSNRSAVGARVWCYTGDLVQMRDVSGNTSYWCFDSLDLEFGLGAAASVDSLVIQWPGGLREACSVDQVDRRYFLTEGSCVPSASPHHQGIPPAHTLHGCYPNPFNPRTSIDYELTAACQVGFRILDLKGKEVWRWGGPRTAGRHTLTWNGRGRDGRPQPSGTYLVQMTAGAFKTTQRIVLVR
jgi:hypothetical protein